MAVAERERADVPISSKRVRLAGAGVRDLRECDPGKGLRGYGWKVNTRHLIQQGIDTVFVLADPSLQHRVGGAYANTNSIPTVVGSRSPNRALLWRDVTGIAGNWSCPLGALR